MSRIALRRCMSLGLIALMVPVATVVADDWMVDGLRGEVQVRIGSSWQSLQRGDIVSDASPIRSLENSRVTFTRDAEAIELSGATEIRIYDQQGQRMTTVMQAYGSVTVEAERLQIQHFSIQTPYLAAIVKGTRFTVLSDDTQSTVEVSRGLVQVQDYVHSVATDIKPGQSALVSSEIVLEVTGGGAHVPLVTLDGELVAPESIDSPRFTLDTEIVNRSADGAAEPSGGQGNGNYSSNNILGSIYSHNAGSTDNNGGNGNAYGHDSSHNGNGNSGNGNGNGGSENNNSGNGNAYGHDNGNGGNNSGNSNGGVENSNNGNGNSENGNSSNGNSGKGNGNSGNSNSGNGNGNSGNGNANGQDK